MADSTATDWQNYGLYTDPYVQRCNNEVDLVLRDNPKESYVAEDFTHFDSMHFCGLNYLEEYCRSLPADQPLKCLDLCAGIGSEARYVATRFPNWHVFAVDFVEGLNGVHRRINDLCGITNIRVEQGDVMNLPLADWGIEGEIDLVYSIQSFLHIPDNDAAYTCIARALKPGGKLYMEDFTVLDDTPITEEEQKELDHLRFCGRLNETQYRAVLEAKGFTVEQYANRTEEWCRYVWMRANMWLGQKAEIIATHGQDVWEGRYRSGTTTVPKLYHGLGMTEQEVRETYPHIVAEWGEEEFRHWTFENPQKFTGSYIIATKNA